MSELFAAMAALIVLAFLLFVTAGFWVMGVAAFLNWLGVI